MFGADAGRCSSRRWDLCASRASSSGSKCAGRIPVYLRRRETALRPYAAGGAGVKVYRRTSALVGPATAMLRNTPQNGRDGPGAARSYEHKSELGIGFERVKRCIAWNGVWIPAKGYLKKDRGSSRIRQTSRPERTRSLPNRDLDLGHEHVAVVPPPNLGRVGGFEKQRQ